MATTWLGSCTIGVTSSARDDGGTPVGDGRTRGLMSWEVVRGARPIIDPSLDQPCRPTLVMSCRALTRHTYDDTTRRKDDVMSADTRLEELGVSGLGEVDERRFRGWWSGTGGSCTCTAIGCSGRSRTPRTPCGRRSSVLGGGGRPSRGGRRFGRGCTGSPPTPAWTCSPSAARSPRPAARCCGCSPTRTGCSTSCPRATRTNRRPSPSRGRRSRWRTWSRSSTSRRARGPC
jgi:hypothetical protein